MASFLFQLEDVLRERKAELKEAQAREITLLKQEHERNIKNIKDEYKEKVSIVFLFGRQLGSPFQGTNKLALLGDKPVALFEGQTSCPYWGTNRLPLLGDK